LSSIGFPPLQRSTGPLSGLIRFFKSHPVMFLFVLTPGIPEYLSASSQITLLVLNPIAFFLFLGANIALYGSGVLLIREAMIRWKKGWASVFLLGVAYGIVEEGVALWTLFNPNAPPVGNLGIYGHWLGVNWVWTAGLLIFHSVYSIGLPIFLFGLVFPELKSKSLIHVGGITASFWFLTFDCIILYLLESVIFPAYRPGGTLILSPLLVITTLVIAAKRLPGNFLKPSLAQPKWTPGKFAIAGILLFPSTLLTGAFAASANAPPIIPIALDLVLAGIILTRAFKAMGTVNNQDCKAALGIGLIIPIACFGLIASIGQGNLLIVLNDVFFVLFARRLWGKWHGWTLRLQVKQPTIPIMGGPATPGLPS
jgi:hypothetical protein